MQSGNNHSEIPTPNAAHYHLKCAVDQIHLSTQTPIHWPCLLTRHVNRGGPGNVPFARRFEVGGH